MDDLTETPTEQLPIRPTQPLRYKDHTRLGGLHPAWIVWCEADSCSNWNVLWVAEHQEKQSVLQATPQAYEIGYVEIDGHWLCPACLRLYYGYQSKDWLQVRYT